MTGSGPSLGQSFGGFCTFTYLSFAPHGLRECLLTGGIPPLTAGIDDVYRSTYRAVRRRIDDLDAAYPETRLRLREVADHLMRTDERLPGGERLTVERLQEVGHAARPRGRAAAAALPRRGRVDR